MSSLEIVSKLQDRSEHACKDFFTLIVHCHVLCAVMDILKMGSLNDVPDIEIRHMDFKNKVMLKKKR